MEDPTTTTKPIGTGAAQVAGPPTPAMPPVPITGVSALGSAVSPVPVADAPAEPAERSSAAPGAPAPGVPPMPLDDDTLVGGDAPLAADEPPQAVPVVPIGRGRVLLSWALTLVGLAALVAGVFTLVRPPIAVETVGDETRVSVSPDVVRRAAVSLLAAGAAAALLAWSAPSPRSREWGGIGLVLVAVLAVPVWHQRAARVVVTPDAVTAPTPSRLLPGAPATVRFDEVAFAHLSDRSDAGMFQYFLMKDGREVRLELGPLMDEAGRLIDAHARGKGARVSWRR